MVIEKGPSLALPDRRTTGQIAKRKRSRIFLSVRVKEPEEDGVVYVQWDDLDKPTLDM
jgi:hypothetical protein